MEEKTNIQTLFNINIPHGILFYPCCGYDTMEPIKLFIDYIDEFHFADYKCLGLPDIKSINNLKRPNIELINSDNDLNKYRIISNSINKELLNINQYLLEAKTLSDSVHTETKDSMLYTEQWNSKEKNIRIFWHKYDALAALLGIDKIAVFFYRGDSIGEGGSGVWWLGEKIFNKILDKLADGGLIITDGSNPDPDWKGALWRELYRHSQEGNWSNNKIIEPSDFIYRQRKFTCLGSIGKRYGTVYVWKADFIKAVN